MRSFLKIIGALAVVFMPSVAFSGTTILESPGCDADVLQTIEERAWMEGQREVEIASRLILKPDSVLEYSCFDDRITELGIATNLLFSERIQVPGPLFTSHGPTISRPDIGGPPFTAQPDLNAGAEGPDPPGPPMLTSNLDNLLNQFVRDIAFSYVTINFGHVYGGGSYSGIPPAAASCNAMNAVWLFLKCRDFNQSYFRRFQELSVSDPRDLPVACNDPNRATNWNNAISAAYLAPATPAVPGGMEAVVTYVNTINYGVCAPPVETGVQVLLAGSPQPDAVCPTPGCYYDGSGACN